MSFIGYVPECPSASCIVPGGPENITLCGKCVDASSLGNITFGMAMNVFEFNWPSTILIPIILPDYKDHEMWRDECEYALGYVLADTLKKGGSMTPASMCDSFQYTTMGHLGLDCWALVGDPALIPSGCSPCPYKATTIPPTPPGGPVVYPPPED
jgi:hypothetical protein